jgi:hypothetical protein
MCVRVRARVNIIATVGEQGIWNYAVKIGSKENIPFD